MTEKKPGIEMTRQIGVRGYKYIFMDIHQKQDVDITTDKQVAEDHDLEYEEGTFLTDTELSALKDQHAKELEEARNCPCRFVKKMFNQQEADDKA